MEKEKERFKVVDTELSIDNLRHIIDVSRPPADLKIIERFSKLEARLKQKDGSFAYKSIKIDGGFEYTKEYPEIALKFNTEIVFHHTMPGDKNPKSKRHPILPKVWEHPKKMKGKHTIHTLVASITKILTVYTNETTAKDIMKKIKD